MRAATVLARPDATAHREVGHPCQGCRRLAAGTPPSDPSATKSAWALVSCARFGRVLLTHASRSAGPGGDRPGDGLWSNSRHRTRDGVAVDPADVAAVVEDPGSVVCGHDEPVAAGVLDRSDLLQHRSGEVVGQCRGRPRRGRTAARRRAKVSFGGCAAIPPRRRAGRRRGTPRRRSVGTTMPIDPGVWPPESRQMIPGSTSSGPECPRSSRSGHRACRAGR